MRWPHKLVIVLLLGLAGWGAALFALGMEDYLSREGQNVLSRFTSLFSPGDWLAVLLFHELRESGLPYVLRHAPVPSKPYWEVEVVCRDAQEEEYFLGRLEALLVPFRPFGLSRVQRGERVYELLWGDRMWFRFEFLFRKAFQVAIVIDDIGYDPRIAAKFFALPVKLNVAILPHTPYGPSLAEEAERKGKEVLIHLPMEALSSAENTGEWFLLRVGMPKEEVARVFREAFARIPQAKGLNNHKGSRATQDRYLMELCALELRKRGMYFLDSLTTSRSLAFQVMEEMGVPALRRDVFLDGATDVAYVLSKLRETLAVARKQGFAIAIGHPKEVTYEALRRFLAEPHPEYEFVFLSEILRERSRR